MKNILLVITIIFSLATEAQVSRVSLQASGLTCSMCSNSIDKALKKLDFVLNVEADIKTYTFEISFKENSVVDFDAIRKRVESAGFAVCKFIVTMNFNNVRLKKDELITVGNQKFLFINETDRWVNGIQKVKLLDKGFVSINEYRQNSLPSSTPGTYHAAI
jgi:copper chaperone CopZ